VGAEIARIEGRAFDAIELYEQAIRSARANGFVHNEAIASCKVRANPILNLQGLRNKLAHFDSDYNYDVFRQVSPEWLEEIEGEVSGWLDQLGQALKYKRIPDTARILKDVMSVAEQSGAYQTP
jgi:hypothetical protein